MGKPSSAQEPTQPSAVVVPHDAANDTLSQRHATAVGTTPYTDHVVLDTWEHLPIGALYPIPGRLLLNHSLGLQRRSSHFATAYPSERSSKSKPTQGSRLLSTKVLLKVCRSPRCMSYEVIRVMSGKPGNSFTMSAFPKASRTFDPVSRLDSRVIGRHPPLQV